MEAKDQPGPKEGPSSEKYDTGFFLVLALKGKDAWNAWRRDPANKDISVIFRGVDFSATKINFEGFEFGDGADFSGCQWYCDYKSIMGNVESFSQGRAYFREAVFGNWALFTGAILGNFANFDGVTFGGDAIFSCASFGYRSHFQRARFGGMARFSGAAFFGGPTAFHQAYFDHGADFTGVSDEDWDEELEKWLFVSSEQKRMALQEKHANLWEDLRVGPRSNSGYFFCGCEVR